MTHEETVTFHAREIQSYRDLPQMLYHFQTKNRDEPRPRAGLIRVREFIMKDSYSFDRDEEGLEKSFQLHEGAYDRIFERCELEVYYVAGRVRDDGRQREHAITLRLPSPARTRSSSASAATTRPIWRSLAAFLGAPSFRRRSTRPRRSRLPARRRSRTSRSCSESTPQRPRRRCRWSLNGKVVLGLVRGDDRLDEGKMTRGARRGIPARDRGGDPRSLRRRSRLDRARSGR